MSVLFIGPENRRQQLPAALAALPARFLPAGHAVHAADLQGVALVFDLEFDAYPERLGLYATQTQAFFFLHSNRIQLAAVAAALGVRLPLFHVAGLNAWPGCLSVSPWEVSLATENALPLLHDKLQALGIEFVRVADRVGMVTPRVICMIINEAYYTLQEGTANKTDIDQGMKLGTNYPHGPFAWSELIGLREVRSLLEAMYADTQDPRYKLCPLLKTESLAPSFEA